MKKIWWCILLLSICVVSYTKVYAETPITLWDFIKIYVESFSKEIPTSYQYIKVNYTNIPSWSELYTSLQKWIYLTLLPNPKSELAYNNIINQHTAAMLIGINFTKPISYDKTKPVTATRLKYTIEELHKETKSNMNEELTNIIYETLKDEYLYQEKINEIRMGYGAIKGFVDALEDPYTEFMPPENAKDFEEEIEWNFEGIGAYIEANKEGVIVIASPIEWSPAEKAWLLAGDIITKIDKTIITNTMKVNDVVKLIKWPKWTKVLITVLRNGIEKSIEVIRDEIIIKNVSHKIFTGNVCYIKITMFSVGVYKEFKSTLQSITWTNCERYIFDVRNDPGWSLQEVISILNHFVPKYENIVTIKEKILNIGTKATDIAPKLTDKKIIILINEWSASASEIFAGTIKEYVPNAILIGETTFWKWSVQTMQEFTDWSILKYTTAKRYTGKEEKNIDKEGIVPDVEIQDNPTTKFDEALEIAKIYEFK